MKNEDVELFIKVKAQITGLYKEIGLLSKKNPNDVVNKFKLKFINESIGDANKLLTGDNRPYSDFEIFAEADMTTTSDVVMILEQYITALHKLQADNTKSAKIESDWGVDVYEPFWIIDGKVSNIISK